MSSFSLSNVPREDCEECSTPSGLAASATRSASGQASLTPQHDGQQAPNATVGQGRGFQEDADRAEDVMDPSTFIPPQLPLPAPYILIEYCNRCRWQHRAAWVQTELLLTFPPPSIQSIALIPRVSPETGGRFRVWLGGLCAAEAAGDDHDRAESTVSNDEGPVTQADKVGAKLKLVWDRKVAGGFPEMKELKQLIRDQIAPKQDLGHSDRRTHG